MSTDIYARVPVKHRVSSRMRASQLIDFASMGVLIAFAVVAAVAISAQLPPRVLDDTQAQRVQ